MSQEFFSGLVMPTEEEISLLKSTSATPVRYCSAGEMPDEIDLFPEQEAEDQTVMNSCCGNAEAQVVEIGLKLKGYDVEISRMAAYLLAQKYGGGWTGDNGASIGGAVRASEDFGMPLEATMSYPISRSPAEADRNYSNSVKWLKANWDKVQAEAANYKFQSHTDIKGPDEVCDYTGSKMGGIIIGIPWDPNSMAASRTGKITKWNASGKSWHAMYFRGFKTFSGVRWPMLCNSHKGWGFEGKGWAYIAPEIVDYWKKFGSTVMIGQSDMNAEELAPRNIKIKGITGGGR